jgi:hypothetical protein
VLQLAHQPGGVGNRRRQLRVDQSEFGAAVSKAMLPAFGVSCG